MKNTLVKLTISSVEHIRSAGKTTIGWINHPLIQDNIVPGLFGVLVVTAYNHASYMVTPLVILFILTMVRNVTCSNLERWKRNHPQTREELNAELDRLCKDTKLPGVPSGNHYVIVGKPRGS